MASLVWLLDRGFVPGQFLLYCFLIFIPTLEYQVRTGMLATRRVSELPLAPEALQEGLLSCFLH